MPENVFETLAKFPVKKMVGHLTHTSHQNQFSESPLCVYVGVEFIHSVQTRINKIENFLGFHLVFAPNGHSVNSKISWK